MGIKKDINLTGDDYQWLSSMFYFGGHCTIHLRSPVPDAEQATWLGNILQTASSSVYLSPNTRLFA